MGLLDNKIVVVIGATSGIGRAAVGLFVKEGARLIAVGRRGSRGAEIEREGKELGGDVRFVQADIADSKSLDNLFGIIRNEYPRLDGAFNNAGIQPMPMLLQDTPDEVFDHVFGVNARGTFQCLRHELKIMTAQKSGAIVNTSSIAGIRGFMTNGVYTASKHAVIGLTKVAAIESAALGVRVNCVLPGGTKSEMMEELMTRRAGGLEATIAGIPMKRTGKPSEPAAAAAWLLSDMASYITGAIVAVDGGKTIA
jgi:NAD(P)-dependent dehydrogenase (short-subunit alcohol dehydrogenase family)